jgi:hypothetical protein
MFFNISITGQIRERTNRFRYGLLLVLVLLSGCRDPHAQSSTIVREVEQAGAGTDISALTAEELRRWFANQTPSFVQKINGECAPLRKTAPAAWHMRTAEGRVCDAVAQIAPLMFKPYQADPRTY